MPCSLPLAPLLCLPLALTLPLALLLRLPRTPGPASHLPLVTASPYPSSLQQLQRAFCEQGGAAVISEDNTDAVALTAQIDAILRDGCVTRQKKGAQ